MTPTSTVRAREFVPADTSTVRWSAPDWAQGGASLTAGTDGWVDIDLTPGDTAALTLVNTATAPLPNTGGTWSPVVAYAGLAAVLLGGALVLRRRRGTSG